MRISWCDPTWELANSHVEVDAGKSTWELAKMLSITSGGRGDWGFGDVKPAQAAVLVSTQVLPNRHQPLSTFLRHH